MLLFGYVDDNKIIVSHRIKDGISVYGGCHDAPSNPCNHKEAPHGLWHRILDRHGANVVFACADNIRKKFRRCRVYLVADLIPIRTLYIQSNDEFNELNKK